MLTIQECLTDKIRQYIYNWKTDRVFRDERMDERVSGVDAIFVPVNDDCGMKFFLLDDVAKISYHLTAILSHIGYTPRAWGLTQVRIQNAEDALDPAIHVWCFMVEKCKVLGEVLDEKYNMSQDRLYNVAHRIDLRMARKLSKYTDFKNCDGHRYNYGITKRGRVVCIDVGHLEGTQVGERYSALLKYL